MSYGRRALLRFGKSMARHSLHGDQVFFDDSQFPWIRDIEANWHKIQAELEEVLTERNHIPNFQDVSPDQAHLAKEDHWKTFFLYAYGYEAPKNTLRCPETTRLVKQIPGMKTAFFSILSKGTHIPPHCGPYKGLLRYHLGLIIPDEQACRIRVGDTIAHWSEGKSLVFDDTFEHEVWNDSSDERVILFVDFLRPLPRALDALNRLFVYLVGLSPLVQDALKNFEKLQQQGL